MITIDITGICPAIDDGDDMAILLLADALEETGGPLAETIRFAASSLYHLPSGKWWVHHYSHYGVGATRSAALLALAEALATDELRQP